MNCNVTMTTLSTLFRPIPPCLNSFRKHTFYTYSYARLIPCFIRFQYVCEYIYLCVCLCMYQRFCAALVFLRSFVLCLFGFYCNDFWHIYWLLNIQVDVYLSLSLCVHIFSGCRHQTIRIFRIRWFIGIEWEIFTWCTHGFDGFWLNLFLIFHSLVRGSSYSPAGKSLVFMSHPIVYSTRIPHFVWRIKWNKNLVMNGVWLPILLHLYLLFIHSQSFHTATFCFATLFQFILLFFYLGFRGD